MSKRQDYERETEKWIQPILDRMGFDLVDVEYVKEGGEYYLRAYIDKPGGINIQDCVDVSHEMNEILDREDYISDPYTFEVSSPGLGRPLKKERDYVRNTGRSVDVRTYSAVDGSKEFTGVLQDHTPDSITLVLDDDSEISIDRKNIALIRESYDL